MNLLTDRTLWISLCSTAQTTLIAYLKHPDHRNSSILFLGNPRDLKIRLIFGNGLRHHCLLHGHGPNATSFIHVNSVPFLSVWNCRSQMMKSCQATKKLTPQERTNLLRGSRWTLTRCWYSIWLMFKKATADFREASCQQPLTFHRSGSASTIETLCTDVEKKMPSNSKLKAGGISLPCRRRANMLVMTFLKVGST